jgi:PAS domain S-box-containing protein
MAVHASTEFGVGGPWLAEYTLTALGAGVVVFDASGRASQWNESGAVLLGVSDQELAGRALHDVELTIVGQDLRPVTEATDPVASVLSTGEPEFKVVLGVVGDEGSARWRSVSLLPVFGVDGQPRAVLAAIVDVHDQFDARRSNAQWQVLAHSFQRESLAANLVVDRCGRIIEWNEYALELTGRTVVDMIDSNFDDLCDIDLRWIWGQVTDASHASVDGVTFVVHRNGYEIAVFGRFSLVEWPSYGEVIAVQLLDPAVFAGNKYSPTATTDAMIFDHADIPLFIISEQGIIVDANPRAAGLLGRERSSLVGQLAAVYLSGLSWTRLQSQIRESRLTLTTVPLGTFDARSADDHTTQVIVSVTAMGTPDAPSPHLLMQLSEAQFADSTSRLANELDSA